MEVNENLPVPEDTELENNEIEEIEDIEETEDIEEIESEHTDGEDYEGMLVPRYKKYSTFNYKNDTDSEMSIADLNELYKQIYNIKEQTDEFISRVNPDKIYEESHDRDCIFDVNISTKIRKDLILFASKINVDGVLDFNLFVDRYFTKYTSIYEYAFVNDGNDNSDKTEISIIPMTIEHFPFSQEDVEDINRHNIASIDFDHYMSNNFEESSSIFPDTSINNLIPNGKTQILHLNEYSGSLENLPQSIKCISVRYSYSYTSRIRELENSGYSDFNEYDQNQYMDQNLEEPDNVLEQLPENTEQDLEQNPEEYINQNLETTAQQFLRGQYESAQATKEVIQQNTLNFGSIILNEGVEWLELHNASYVNLELLPRTLKGLILGKLSSVRQEYYYRDYINFPPILEVLSLSVNSYSKIVCPDTLKTLKLITEMDDVDIDLTIPDTLERLIYFGQTKFLKKLPSHLKTLKTTVTDFEFLRDNIPLGLEELDIDNQTNDYTPPIAYRYKPNDVELLVDTISKLKSLKLLIINISEGDVMTDFETRFYDALSQKMPTYKSINIFFVINIRDNILNNINSLKYGYCDCY